MSGDLAGIQCNCDMPEKTRANRNSRFDDLQAILQEGLLDFIVALTDSHNCQIQP